MRTNSALAVAPVDVTPLSAIRRGAKGVWRALGAVFAMVLVVVGAYSGLVHKPAQDARALDVSKWVLCGFGQGSVPAQLYQFSQSNDLQYEVFSKSAVTSGQSTPDSGANILLKLVGVDLEKNNQQLVIGGTDISNGSGFNKGAKLNFFDRFGLGGYQFTAYTGEWRYVVIDACADKPEAKDPKSNQYYDTRLTPMATWDRASASQDPRTMVYANGQTARHAAAVGTFIGNLALGATTWVVGFFLALLMISFKDVGKLIGLTDILVGSKPGQLGGILDSVYGQIFLLLAIPIFVWAVVSNFYPLATGKPFPGTVEHTGRPGRRLSIAVVTAVFSIGFITAAPVLMPIPNRVAAFVQSITIKATTEELTSMGGWCTTEVGTKPTSTYDARSRAAEKGDGGVLKRLNTAGNDISQIVSENYGEIVASQLSCTFSKLFIFDPWVQGQFGVPANHLWAEGKDIPEWAKDGKKLGNSNGAWVGDASVPMGGETTLNNWALYQLSTQTTGHLPTGNETAGKARESQGVATDWWRIVDALSNYNEKDIDLKIPQAKDLPTNVSNGEWARPTEAAMTSPYGNRPELGDVHKGIDFGAQCGAPIYSAGNGKVVFAQKASDGANGIIIQHNGYATMYWHMQDGSLKVKVGDEVKAGQEIASSGDTGHAYGCHLHFEVRPGTDWGNQDNVTDPQPWLKERGIDPTKTGDGLSPHAAVTSTNNNGTAIEITRGEQDMNSKPLEPWNTWTGASGGTRIGAGLSALIVSIIALFVPSIIALLTTVTTITLQIFIIIVPFAALALMTGTEKGIAFAKKYGEQAYQLFLLRITLGLLLTLSVIFTLWSYTIMATVGWWQGVLLMALLSVVLWVAKDKLIAIAETYAGALVSKPSRLVTGLLSRTKAAAGIGTAGTIGGITAKTAGGSFFKGAHTAASDKTRDAFNKSKAGRRALRTLAVPANYAPEILRKATGHTAKTTEPIFVTCFSCEKTYKHGEIQMWRDQDTNRMYCQTCVQRGRVAKTDMLTRIKTKADERQAKKRSEPREDTYLKMALAQPHVHPANIKNAGDAFNAYETLTDAAANSMARHYRTVHDDKLATVISYELPEEFKPYLNVEAYEVARDNDDFTRMRFYWAQAIKSFVEEELGYTINRDSAEMVNDIQRKIDRYSPWWTMDPNAKREGENVTDSDNWNVRKDPTDKVE